MWKTKKGFPAVLCAAYLCSIVAREGLRGTFLLVISDFISFLGTLVLLAWLGGASHPEPDSVASGAAPVSGLRAAIIKGAPVVMLVASVSMGLYAILSRGLIIGLILLAPHAVAWVGGQAGFRIIRSIARKSGQNVRTSVLAAARVLILIYVVARIPLQRLRIDEQWNHPVYAAVALVTVTYSVAAWWDR